MHQKKCNLKWLDIGGLALSDGVVHLSLGLAIIVNASISFRNGTRAYVVLCVIFFFCFSFSLLLLFNTGPGLFIVHIHKHRIVQQHHHLCIYISVWHPSAIRTRYPIAMSGCAVLCCAVLCVFFFLLRIIIIIFAVRLFVVALCILFQIVGPSTSSYWAI